MGHPDDPEDAPPFTPRRVLAVFLGGVAVGGVLTGTALLGALGA